MSLPAVTPFHALNGSSGAGNVTLTQVASVGDLIEVFVAYRGLTGQVSPTITDNLNTGNYNILRNEYFAGQQVQFVTAWLINTKPGLLTVSATGFTGTTVVSAAICGPFSFTPTFMGDLTSGYNAASTAVESGSFVSSFNSELVMAWGAAANQTIGAMTGWTNLGLGSKNGRMFYQSNKAAGITFDYNVSITSDQWYMMAHGFNDVGNPNVGHWFDQQSTSNSAGAASLATPNLSVNQGDTVIAVVACDSSATLKTPTFSGGTFVQIGANTTVGSFTFGVWQCNNCTGGSFAVTGSVVSGTAVHGVLATTYTGVQVTSPLLASILQSVAAPGSGANTLSSTAQTVTLPTGCPGALIVGFCLDVTTTLISATAGNSPIAFNKERLNGTPWNTWGHRIIQEDAVISATGSTAVTFNPGTGTTDTWFVVMLGFALDQSQPGSGLLAMPTNLPTVISGINTVLTPAVARPRETQRRIFLPPSRRIICPQHVR